MVPPAPLRRLWAHRLLRLLPAQHASRHARESGHAFLTSFEPGEDWFWNAETQEYYDGPGLAPPGSHPTAQPAPGPVGKVPENWERLLH